MGNKDRRVARIWKEINELLWNQWDPIGVKGVDAARDEYHDYIHGIFCVLEDRANVDQIAKHLHHIETVKMGLKGDMHRCMKVARALLQLNLSE